MLIKNRQNSVLGKSKDKLIGVTKLTKINFDLKWMTIDFGLRTTQIEI